MTSSTPTCWTVVSGMPGERRRFGRTVQELWQEEQAKSAAIAGEAAGGLYLPSWPRSTGASKSGLAGNWYSVPPEYVGRLVTVQAYVFRVDDGLPGPGALPPMSAATAGRKRSWIRTTTCRSC